MLEREREISAIVDAISDAASGHGRLVIVDGEGADIAVTAELAGVDRLAAAEAACELEQVGLLSVYRTPAADETARSSIPWSRPPCTPR